jgi:hypothetical protein
VVVRKFRRCIPVAPRFGSAIAEEAGSLQESGSRHTGTAATYMAEVQFCDRCVTVATPVGTDRSMCRVVRTPRA